MEELYRKVGNKYVKVGYTNAPDLYDGVWLVQENKHSKSTSSLVWRIGDIPMADMRLFTSLIKHSDKLISFLMKLKDENSDEYKKAKEMSGMINGPLEFYNWSASDLITVLVKEMGSLLQKESEEDGYIKFTKTESQNNRKDKLEYLSRKILIENIVEELKKKKTEELKKVFGKINNELMEDLLLLLYKMNDIKK